MNRLKTTLANWLLKHLFNAITEHDVLRFNGTHLILRGRQLTQAEVQDLRSQADVINQLAIWQLLKNEAQHAANQMLFQKSKTAEDLIFGKAVLYVVDLLDKKVNQIA